MLRSSPLRQGAGRTGTITRTGTINNNIEAMPRITEITMGYSSGILKDRVKILKRVTVSDGFGRGGSVEWHTICSVWADVTWSRGVKAMREGALDAYDSVMVRMRWHNDITRDCRLEHDGKVYEIESLNSSKQRNEVQITAHEILI
jgi:SPP1 family predicted phage head-tail adaptor